MFDAKVPNLWRKVSWPSSSIGFWFTELLERNDQFSKWVFEDRPKCFWLTGFFNAQGSVLFLHVLVDYSNKSYACLDSLNINSYEL